MITEELVIVIPIFNCKKQILRVIDRIEQIDELKEIKKIIIDNNSNDNGYIEAARKLKDIKSKNWKVHKNNKNYGLGGSFKIAYSIVKEMNYKYMIWLHGDDQIEIKEVLYFIEKREQYDAIFGSRFSKTSLLKNYSKIRKMGNLFLNAFVSILINKKITELGSGLNLFRIESLPESELKYWPNHIAFDMRLLFHFHTNEYNVCEIPISWFSTDQKSNANNLITGVQIILITISHLFKLDYLKESNRIDYKYEHIYEC